MPNSRKDPQTDHTSHHQIKLIQLISQLEQDFPNLHFEASSRFLFHPPNTIFYTQNITNFNHAALLLLHELGHAINNEFDYQNDIELVRIEAQAWQNCAHYCKTYHIPYDEDYAEDCLDSYRDLLHHNSLCPNCAINGYQDHLGIYHCPLCHKNWKPKYHAS